MSHMVEKLADGSYSMAYVGEVPWHSLGVKVEPGMSPEEFMKVCGADWTVSKHPLFAYIAGKKIKSGVEALIRDSDNKYLSTVTAPWNPLQNAEAFKFFNDFVEAGDMTMETGGVLRDGQQVWALAKVGESFTLANGDKVEGYLLFSNPHQFGKSIDIRFVAIRVVCNNTLTFALEGSAKHKVRVTHRSEFNPEVVKQMLGIANIKMSKYKEIAEVLSSAKYDEKQLLTYFDKVFPPTGIQVVDENATSNDTKLSRNARQALGIIDTQPGAELAPRSWWNAYNAVTFITTHEMGHNQSNRLYNSFFGQNQARNIKALNLATTMATD